MAADAKDDRKITLMSRIGGFKFLLILLVAAVAVFHYAWIKMHRLPPVGNGLQDLLPGINFYRDVQGRGVVNLRELHLFAPAGEPYSLLWYLRHTFFVYPPLAPLSYALFYFLFPPPGSGIELMANVAYLAVAMLSIFGIGRRLFNAKAGLLAAFIFASFPGVIAMTREVFSEFIMTCLVSLALYLLLTSGHFLMRGRSLLLGIALGLCALAKWEFFPALLGPFALVLFFPSKKAETGREKEEAKRRVINLGLSLLAAALISILWYYPAFPDILWRVFQRPHENVFTFSRTTFSQHLFSLMRLSFYPLAVINTHLRFAYFLVLMLSSIAGAFALFKRRRMGFAGFFLLGWILVPYLFFTPPMIHAPSHILVILPALALGIAGAVFAMRRPWAKFPLLALVLAAGLYSFLHSFVILPAVEPLMKLKLILTENDFSLTRSGGFIIRDSWEPCNFEPPVRQDGKERETLAFIKGHSVASGQKPSVLVLNALNGGMCFNYQYYNLLGDSAVYIEPRGNDCSPAAADRSLFDYVIIHRVPYMNRREGLLRVPLQIGNMEQEHKFEQLRKDFFRRYSAIKEFETFDSIVTVYALNRTAGP